MDGKQHPKFIQIISAEHIVALDIDGNVWYWNQSGANGNWGFKWEQLGEVV